MDPVSYTRPVYNEPVEEKSIFASSSFKNKRVPDDLGYGSYKRVPEDLGDYASGFDID